MNIGIIGYGGVAKAFIKLVNEKKSYLDENNIKLDIKYVVKSDGGAYIKEGSLGTYDNLKDYSGWKSTLDYEAIVNDNDIDMVIELTNTNIETGEPATTHIISALKNKKHVVTGNKGPVLKYYKKLKRLSGENRVGFGIGCTVGGALPSYIVGKSGLLGSEILSIRGILNGTSNFVLDEMDAKQVSYEDALIKAQELGIAEKNPKFDVGGFDTASKMIIMVNSICNKELTYNNVSIKGIEEVKLKDILEAKINCGKIKLVGEWNKENENIIEVKPMIIEAEDLLYGVNGKNKGIVFKSDTLGEIFVAGGESSTIGAAASIFRDVVNIIMEYE